MPSYKQRVLLLSHVGRDQDFWEPLALAVGEIFDVEVVIAERKVGNLRPKTAKELMDRLIEDADLGLFVYTRANENVDYEL